MKKILIIISLFIISLNISADENTIDMRGLSMSERIKIMSDVRRENRIKSESVTEQSESFMKELSKGIDGVNNAKSKVYGQRHVDEINKEAGIEKESSFNKLRSAMTAKDGEINQYRKIAEEVSLNDNLVKEEYLIEYKNGNTQKVELLYIKPTISGGFKLMEVNVAN